MDIQIKHAGPGDWGVIQKLNSEVFEHDSPYDATIDLSYPASEEGIKYYRETVGGNEYISFIAYHSDVPVGYIVGFEKKYSWRKGKFMEIDNMGVSPSYRSRGVGKLLVDKIKQTAKGMGFEHLRVCAYVANNRAISFYQQNGFSQMDTSLELSLI